jgi:uncharacterized protein
LPKKAAETDSKVQRAILFVALLAVVASGFTLVPLFLYDYSYMSYSQFNFASDAAVELAFLAAALLYTRFISIKARGRASRGRGLGLGRDGLTWRNVALGLSIFALMILLELIVSLIGQVGNVTISTGVDQAFTAAPIWFLAFSATVAPVCEEVMFRGVMVPRLGIVVSALLFAALHAGYNSTFGVEVIAALAFGLVAGYVFRKTGSLYPSIIAHIMVNALTVLVTFGPGL